MALHGTIKDFALPDIFQLVGIQRKTGVLTLENGDDTVTIKFMDGQVVGADTQSKTLEDRLGEVLVRTGRITEAQLDEALNQQKQTLQRLGYLLVNAGHISRDDLVDALRVQSSQIIYRLFRWHDGSYHFDAVNDMEYDQKHFAPISSETILMEGARMIDEWPIIERRIKSDKVVLRKADAAQKLDLNEASIIDDDIEFDLDFPFDSDGPPEAAPEKAEEKDDAVKLSAEEREILVLVDGSHSVAEICDLQSLGEFDCYRILADLLTRHLIEEVPRSRANDETRRPSIAGKIAVWVVEGAIAIAVLLGLVTLPQNPLTPWRLLERAEATGRLRHYNSLSQLEKLERALQVFYLDAGTLPDSLDVLSGQGYVRSEDLTDPFGRQYRFQLSPGGYTLMGLTADGEPSPQLTVSRRFNAAQQRMLAGEERTPN